jgi:hypothetical protein
VSPSGPRRAGGFHLSPPRVPSGSRRSLPPALSHRSHALSHITEDEAARPPTPRKGGGGAAVPQSAELKPFLGEPLSSYVSLAPAAHLVSHSLPIGGQTWRILSTCGQ